MPKKKKVVKKIRKISKTEAKRRVAAASTKQRRWQLKMKYSGRCVTCGAKRKHFSQLCDPCYADFKAYLKRWRANKKAKAAAKNGGFAVIV